MLYEVITLNKYFNRYVQSLNILIRKNENFDYLILKYNISQREKEIILLLIEGKSNNYIKESLFISYHTVKNHITNIYKKLNVKNRHELIHFFLMSGNSS